MVNKRRYAIVREADGFVVNVTVWDGITPWNALPDGQVAMECPAQVGPTWSYIEGEWVEPPLPPPVEEPPVEVVEEQPVEPVEEPPVETPVEE